MAQGNNNNRPNNGQGGQRGGAATGMTQEKYDNLVQICPTAFSLSGWTPTGTQWRLTESQIEEIILRISKTYIDDANSVSIMVDRRNGSLSAYVTLPNNSHHIASDDLKSGNSAIKRSMRMMSKEIKEFMDKFCMNNRRNLIKGTNSNYVGIEVDILKFMKIEFDENGNEFRKQFGGHNKKTEIVLYPYFFKGKEGSGGIYGALNYIRVEKTLPNRLDTNKWRPKQSYNVR